MTIGINDKPQRCIINLTKLWQSRREDDHLYRELQASLSVGDESLYRKPWPGRETTHHFLNVAGKREIGFFVDHSSEKPKKLWKKIARTSTEGSAGVLRVNSYGQPNITPKFALFNPEITGLRRRQSRDFWIEQWNEISI